MTSNPGFSPSDSDTAGEIHITYIAYDFGKAHTGLYIYLQFDFELIISV